jgi:hypothetical protein
MVINQEIQLNISQVKQRDKQPSATAMFGYLVIITILKVWISVPVSGRSVPR